MATQRQLSKEKSIAAILEAALCEFSEKSYAGATVRSIAARAGVSTGLIVRYFESKDGLLCEVINRNGPASVFSGFGDTDPFRIFCRYTDYVREVREKDPRRFGLVLRVVSESGFPDSVHESIKKVFEGSPLEAAILEAQREGDLSEGDAFTLFRLLSGSLYVLLNQYAELEISPPDNESLLQVLGYRRREREYREALKKASELESFRKRLNDERISRMSDTDGLFLIDCGADTRKTVHDIRALKNDYTDDEPYTAAINRYISTLVIEEDRELMRGAVAPERMLELTAGGKDYTVEYRSISTGVPRYYEMRVAAFSDTEVLQSFRENDIGIFSGFVYRSLENEYFALLGADLDAGTARILKASPWYPDAKPGDSLSFSRTMLEAAGFLEGEEREFFERISDTEYLKTRLRSEEKLSCVYRSPAPLKGRWVNAEVRVLSRHADGTPSLLALGFSLLDAEAAEKEELRSRLKESLTFTNFFLDRYVSAYYVGLEDMSCRVYQRTDRLNREYPIITDYLESLDEYIARDVHPDDRAAFTEITRPENLKRELAARPELTCTLRDISGNGERKYLFRAIRGADGAHAAFGFIDISGKPPEAEREAEDSRRGTPGGGMREVRA